MATVHVETGAWGGAARLLERAVRAALAGGADADAEVSLTLVDDDAIRELHARYLGRDTTTDVLSFSLGDGGETLGDVYVCLPQAERQAAELGIAVEEELIRLAVHGTLHVLGHDHPDGPERLESAMFVRQEALVRSVLAQEDAP